MDLSAETSNHSFADSDMPPVPDRVRFPRSWTRRFYSCMCCSNHILDVPRPSNYQNAVIRTPKALMCYASQMVNVRFGGLQNSRFRRRVLSMTVYCDQCGEPLGESFAPTGIATNCILFRKHFLYWDGYFTIYADTMIIADVDNDGIDTR